MARTGSISRLPAFYRMEGGGALPKGSFVALVPGMDAPLLPLDLPPGLKGPARERVAQRQIADVLGTGGNGGLELRPATLGKTAALWDRALVTDPDQRAKWQAALAPAAGRCNAILPEYLALPTGPDCWAIETQGDMLNVRLGPGDGFTAETALGLVMLGRALGGEAPRAVLLMGTPPAELPALFAAHDIPLCSTLAEVTQAGLPAPRILAHGEASLDLARDPGAALRDMQSAVRPLLVPVVLALMALGLWSTGSIMETSQLRAQALAHRKSAETIVRDTMIPTGPILDMRAQVAQVTETRARAAAGAGDRHSELDTLHSAAMVLTRENIPVQTIGYRAGADLSVDIQVADFAALEALTQALSAQGIEGTVAQSSTADAGGVQATLTLRARAGAN